MGSESHWPNIVFQISLVRHIGEKYPADLQTTRKAFYMHELVAHGKQVVDFFKEHLPGLAPQDFNCEMQELNNKLVKTELPPLIPMMRPEPPRKENALFYIMC
jgi:hypothetical protein